MCGRFVLAGPGHALSRLFGLEPLPGLGPRFNIAPLQPVLAVRLAPGPSRAIQAWTPRWGLVPAWSKDDAGASGCINARAESAARRPMFRDALRTQRCLVPADGFYEWTKRPRQPFLFRRPDGEPFAFAGLWDRWTAPDGSPLETVAILTTDASTAVAPVHDRMPLILAPDEFDAWLDPAIDDPRRLEPLLDPYEGLAATPVTTFVNDVKNEGPQCVEPEPHPPVQGRLPL